MKVDIGLNLKTYNDFTKVNLPTSSSSYYEILSIDNKGDFMYSSFKFNNDGILFKIEIDGEAILEVNLRDMRTMFEHSNKFSRSPFTYNKENKTFEVSFDAPLAFRESIRFYAKADSGSNKRDLMGYFITTVNEG